MACLHGTYQWFMNRIRNAKIRIIALFCCALWASGVLTGILVRTSLPKAIPKSIPKPNPICGYKIRPSFLCTFLWFATGWSHSYFGFVFHSKFPLLFVLCVGQQVCVVAFTVNTFLFVMVESALFGVPFSVVEFDFIDSGSYGKQIGRLPQFPVSIPAISFFSIT